ncbi:DEAD/DEAH box helicase [Thermincola potens]|uniref:ATP-dependent RNA helicase CshA n=1 Tax=Thermincola potens (strain JR) TaxID=635013 RepID=D5XF75_THEPJ|nr:DEAD/DEAH box helicase [Thermincola potens]ADG82296.1 DEAD/DEAH box helicase domain protein [Thermincola potens JR]
MLETKTFESLQLSRRILQAVKEMGFEEPTPIQAEAIPVLLNGHDVIGQAQTGTGKTAAFGIPILEKLNPRYRAVQALVITPTRELAIQVAEEIMKLGKFKDVRTLAVYGGQSIDRQIGALKRGVQVVVGTPGRLLDHINRGTLRLQHLKMLVLDEADEMLDMGFIDDIEAIIKETPETRQTLLFSATMPHEIQQLARKYLKNPRLVAVSKDELTVPSIEQVYYEVREKTKLESLCRVLETIDVTLAIIFCKTKRGVDELVASLETRGYQAEGLHGDLTQAQRNKVMRKFKNGQVDYLVATDVAARGLDIENVSHVINYDIPQDPEVYVHRIGRTGRAGRSGKAITFIVPEEYRQLRLIEKIIGARIARKNLPSIADIFERQKVQMIDKVANTINGGQLDIYRDIVQELAADYNLIDIASAALKLALDLELPAKEIEVDEADFGETGARPGMVRLFMNIGRQEEMTPPEIIKLIAEEAAIPGKSIGAIRIFDRFSFVEVPQQVAEQVMYSLHKTEVKGKKLFVEPAKVRK